MPTALVSLHPVHKVTQFPSALGPFPAPMTTRSLTETTRYLSTRFARTWRHGFDIAGCDGRCKSGKGPGTANNTTLAGKQIADLVFVMPVAVFLEGALGSFCPQLQLSRRRPLCAVMSVQLGINGNFGSSLRNTGCINWQSDMDGKPLARWSAPAHEQCRADGKSLQGLAEGVSQTDHSTNALSRAVSLQMQPLFRTKQFGPRPWPNIRARLPECQLLARSPQNASHAEIRPGVSGKRKMHPLAAACLISCVRAQPGRPTSFSLEWTQIFVRCR